VNHHESAGRVAGVVRGDGSGGYLSQERELGAKLGSGH
jgi:hypothetical protein